MRTPGSEPPQIHLRAPRKTEVDVWVANVLKGSPPVGKHVLLSDAADGAHFAALMRTNSPHAHRFLWGRALIRLPMAAYTGVPAECFAFRRGPYGRPELKCSAFESFPRFNVSHTRGLSVCAFSSGLPVGVDVEALHVHWDVEGIARVALSDQERKDLRGLGDEWRGRHLVLLWSLKEAYLKALGVGLLHAPNCLSFYRNSRGQFRLQQSGRATWSFHAGCLTSAHSLAVALRGGQPRIRLRFLDELLPAEAGGGGAAMTSCMQGEIGGRGWERRK